MEKYFTIESANHSLAIVEPIVSDIVRKMKEATLLHEQVKREKESAASEFSLLEKLNAAEKLLNEVEYHMKELENVGGLLKDLSLGLVDFPCLYDGRVVYLCWKLGENGIGFWHEVDRGFSDRKPVDETFQLKGTLAA